MVFAVDISVAIVALDFEGKSQEISMQDMGFSLRVFVVVATVGRPETTFKTIDNLCNQTRPADGIIVVSVTEADVAGVGKARGTPVLLRSERGSCKQRNAGIREVEGKADIIVFFDDDFVPEAHYLENVERIFQERADVVGITGELRADGIHSGGISFQDAVTIAKALPPVTPKEQSRQALYGCNMAIRATAAEGLEFDEELPLYGWQEDIDYSYQLARKGSLISTEVVTGVHMGVSGGRTSGVRLGYSQVANMIYLARKGTVPAEHWRPTMLRNLLSNLVRSFIPQPRVDYRGRLKGNWMAIGDWVRGRVHPSRILSL